MGDWGNALGHDDRGSGQGFHEDLPEFWVDPGSEVPDAQGLAGVIGSLEDLKVIQGQLTQRGMVGQEVTELDALGDLGTYHRGSLGARGRRERRGPMEGGWLELDRT
jgi:hypothetical protein